MIGERLMLDKFQEAIDRNNVSFQCEVYCRQWINIRLELSLAFLTELICLLIWFSKVKK